MEHILIPLSYSKLNTAEYNINIVIHKPIMANNDDILIRVIYLFINFLE